MLKDVIGSFKVWVTSSAISDVKADIKANIAYLNSKIMNLEAAEKSRKDALESMVYTEGIEVSALKCDDCVSMRLEIDALRNVTDEMKSRLEALEAAKKNGSEGNGGQPNGMYATPISDKSKPRRRKNGAKELVA